MEIFHLSKYLFYTDLYVQMSKILLYKMFINQNYRQILAPKVCTKDEGILLCQILMKNLFYYNNKKVYKYIQLPLDLVTNLAMYIIIEFVKVIFYQFSYLSFLFLKANDG